MFHPLTKAISLLALAILGLAMDTPSNSVVNSVHDTTPMKWHQTWVPTGKIEFKCNGATASFMAPPGENVPSKQSDCEAAANELLFKQDKMGYWKMDQWIDPADPGQIPSYKIYAYGTCEVWALSIVDQEIQIGSGDVLALIQKSLSDWTKDGKTTVTADIDCSAVTVYWGIENGDGA